MHYNAIFPSRNGTVEPSRKEKQGYQILNGYFAFIGFILPIKDLGVDKFSFAD
jgi:hypothetical protein